VPGGGGARGLDFSGLPLNPRQAAAALPAFAISSVIFQCFALSAAANPPESFRGGEVTIILSSSICRGPVPYAVFPEQRYGLQSHGQSFKLFGNDSVGLKRKKTTRCPDRYDPPSWGKKAGEIQLSNALLTK